jgi:hypothetical protein
LRPRSRPSGRGIADQSSGVRERLPGWPAALAAPVIPASAVEIRSWLAGPADAATIRYLSYGHGNGIMLVHSAAAPGAVLRTLLALDTELWAPAPEDTFAWAVDHGDEHVIKFADTAADVYARTGNADALAGTIRAADLIER